MKSRKLAAVGATLALAVGSVIGLSAAASGVEVPIDSIGTEGASYPAGTWFVGNPAGPALSQDAAGLTIPARNQVLYGQSISGVDSEEFADLIAGASFKANGPLTFQVPVFFDGEANTEFTTLRPAVTGTPVTTTKWISSQSVAGLDKNVEYSFDDILKAFDTAEGDAEVLAFGVLSYGEGSSAVLQSVTWNGTTWTFATPLPTAVVPTPVKDSATFTG